MSEAVAHTHSHSESAPTSFEGTPRHPVEETIRITNIAASKVNEIREAEGIESEMALRLRVVGGGCAGFSYYFYFDTATELDRSFACNGVRVVVDQMSLMYLMGTEVDYIESLQGAGFKFNNPNVKSTCGCGSSFRCSRLGVTGGAATGSSPLARLPYATVVSRLRQRLHGLERIALKLDGFRPAAVAVLLVDRDGVARVALTLRSQYLRAHSGQVSFPGGTRDKEDSSTITTAIRECQEELGIEPRHLDVIGMMDDEPTTSRFVITPVVVALNVEPHYVPNPDEVAQVFEAPLAVFADRSQALDLGTYSLAGMTYASRVYHYQEHCIQGATARILERMNDLIR